MKKTLSTKLFVSAMAFSVFFGIAAVASAQLIQWDYPEAGKCRVTTGSTSWDGTMEYDSDGNPTCVKPSANTMQASVVGLNQVLFTFGSPTGTKVLNNVWNYFNSVFPQSTKS